LRPIAAFCATGSGVWPRSGAAFSQPNRSIWIKFSHKLMIRDSTGPAPLVRSAK
jgi:hypothetical protein